MTTLVEELEQAADVAYRLKDYSSAQRLHARAAWVRESLASIDRAAYTPQNHAVKTWLLDLTGPIPSETAPAAEPPPRPTIAELEAILASPERDYTIEVLPNGEVRAVRKTVPYCGGCDGGCALCRNNPPVESTGQDESPAAPKEGTVCDACHGYGEVGDYNDTDTCPVCSESAPAAPKEGTVS